MPHGRKWAGGLFILTLAVRPHFSGVAYPFFQGFLLAVTLLAVSLLLLQPSPPWQYRSVALRPMWPLLFLALWSLASLWWSADPGQGIREFATLLLDLSAFGLAASLVSADKVRFSTEKLTVFLVIFPVTLYALFQRFYGFKAMGESLTGIDIPGSQAAAMSGIISQGRVFGAFLNPNILAGFLAVAIPFTLALSLDGKGRGQKEVLGALTILECLVLFLTGSLGGLLATVCGVGLFLSLSVRLNWKVYLTGFFAAVSGVASVFIIRGAGFLTGPENSLWQRLGYIRAGARMAAEHPFLGWGTGAFPSVLAGFIPAGIRPVTDPHNFMVYIWGSWGLAGVGLFLTFIFLWARPIIRTMRGNRRNLVMAGLVGSSVAFLLHSLVDMDFSTPESAFFGWAVMGAAMGLAVVKNGREGARQTEKRSLSGSSIFICSVALALILPAVIYSQGEICGFLGRRAFDGGDFKGARGMYHNALDIIPFSGQFTLMEGLSLVRTGQPEEARDLFQRAGRLMGRSPYPPWELSKLAGSAGDYGKALFYLRKALERYPSSPWIRIDMAKALAGLGRWDEAGDTLAEVTGYGQFDRRATDTAQKYLDEIRSRSKRL